MKTSPKLILTALLLFSVLFIGGCTSTNVAVTPDQVTTKNYLAQANERGEIYSLKQYHRNVSNGENKTLLVRTNGKEVRILEYAFTGTDAPQDIFLYENVSVSSNGTLIETFNRNRSKSDNSTAIWYSEPTVVDYGTSIDRDLLTGNKKVGGQVRRVPYSWILRPNTTYAITNINRGNTSEQIFNVIWLER